MRDHRIDRLAERIQQLADDFRRIEEAAGEQREAAIARSGLPRDLVLRMLEAGGVETPLTFDRDSTIIANMPAIDSADFVRGVARSKHKDHPWLKAMYGHRDPAKRLTVTAWAKQNDYKPGSAASWLSGKRIPLSAAKLIEEQYGVKATLRNWPNGIFDDA